MQYIFESKVLQKDKELSRQCISSGEETMRSCTLIIALSFLSPGSRPSEQAVHNPGSTTCEIVAAPSNLRSRDGTMKCEIVRKARN